MPPKSTQKPKTADQPAAAPAAPAKRTRKPKVPDAEANHKKPKEAKTLKILEHDSATPIDVTYEGDSIHAKATKNGDTYIHTLKLTSPCAFALVRTTVLTDGDFAGYQAIILRPAKSFPLLKLPNEARKRVYTYYFAPQGVIGKEIPLEGRRTNGSKDLYTKSYAEGSKNRVGLLAVNKEVFAEAVGVLYDNKLRFETTTTLNDFLAQLESAMRARLTNIVVNTWVKTTSRNTMLLLCESRNLRHLHIDSNVFSEGDPAKAARYFFSEAGKLLDTLAAAKGGGPGAGVDDRPEVKEAAAEIVTFGPKALTYKDDGGKSRGWGGQMKEEFKKALVAKMK